MKTQQEDLERDPILLKEFWFHGGRIIIEPADEDSKTEVMEIVNNLIKVNDNDPLSESHTHTQNSRQTSPVPGYTPIRASINVFGQQKPLEAVAQEPTATVRSGQDYAYLNTNPITRGEGVLQGSFNLNQGAQYLKRP